MKTKIIIGIVLIVVILGGIGVILYRNSSHVTTALSGTAATSAPIVPTASSTPSAPANMASSSSPKAGLITPSATKPKSQNISPVVNNTLCSNSNYATELSPIRNVVQLTPDSLQKLESVIKNNNGAIPSGELNGLKCLQTLSLSHVLSNISALSYLTNLQTLNLVANAISDVSPLADLIKLKNLDLSWNDNISDISPLANLTNLQTLDLSANRVSDISSLANLTNLQMLNLSGNNVSDASIPPSLKSVVIK